MHGKALKERQLGQGFYLNHNKKDKNMSKKKQIVVQETSRSTKKEPTMSMSREQRNAAKRVDNAYKKALVACAAYETAQTALMMSDAAARSAKDTARKAKSDARKADAEYFEAVKAAFGLDKGAYTAGMRVAQQTPPSPLPPPEDVDDPEGYVCDENDDVYYNP